MENEKIQEILKDKEFSSQVLKMETPEEVQKAFKQKGIELSLEEVGIIGDLVNSMIAKNSTSLSEEDLEEIAGGGQADEPFALLDTIVEIPAHPAKPRTAKDALDDAIRTWGSLDVKGKAVAGASVGVGLGILGLSAIGLGTVAAVGGYKAVKWAGKKILGRR